MDTFPGPVNPKDHIPKLKNIIKQLEDLVLWHITHGDLSSAQNIAGKVGRKRELLRILEQAEGGQ